METKENYRPNIKNDLEVNVLSQDLINCITVRCPLIFVADYT